MKSIQVNETTKIKIDTFDWQTSPQGNKFRLTGLRKNLQLPPKWVNKSEKYHWIYTFLYEDGKQFEIEIGFDDKFLKLTK